MENFTTYSSELREAILSRPALAAPDGRSNLDNPPNNNRGAIVFITICTIITVSLGILRLYTRLFIIKGFKAADCKSTYWDFSRR